MAPGDYVAAWRHVRARFRRAGATNAIWVWNPIAAYDGSTPLAGALPRRREVDWLAVDGYNWGDIRAWGWQSYADVFAPTVRGSRRSRRARPVMIAETGSAPGPRKAAWVTDTLRRAHADGVDAVVWFEFDKETDWRLAGDTRPRGRGRGAQRPRLAPGRRPRRGRASRATDGARPPLRPPPPPPFGHA